MFDALQSYTVKNTRGKYSRMGKVSYLIYRDDGAKNVIPSIMKEKNFYYLDKNARDKRRHGTFVLMYLLSQKSIAVIRN